MEEKKQIKKQLDEELAHLRFTKQEDVLNKITHSTWKDKFQQNWNKEISIPLLPVSSLLVLLLVGYGFFTVQSFNEEFEQIETIEIGGSTYWKAEVERRITNEE